MTVFNVNGDLSFETVPQWAKALQQQLNGSELTLDLTQVARADSAGLAFLVSALATARQRQINLQLLGAPAQLRQLARVSGVEHVLPFSGS
jgi:phospholipid transport system transporter-binding protein